MRRMLPPQGPVRLSAYPSQARKRLLMVDNHPAGAGAAVRLSFPAA
jgi:hypothetical protein